MVRSSHDVVSARESLVDEMATGELGDQRLNDRRNRLIAMLEQHPDAGFPDACANDAEVEALYRFLRNRRFSWDALFEPHATATHARCAALGEVLVIHDTTDMVFAGEMPRMGLAPLGKGRHGFWLHAALAVSADGLRAPLGLVSLAPFIRKTRPVGTRKSEQERFDDPQKESRCWIDGVTTVRERLDRAVQPIHLMDREGDSYELFAAMIQYGDRFVVRLNHDRRLLPDGTESSPEKLSHAVSREDAICERQVFLSPRRLGNRPLQARKKHPPREGRVARLRFAARRVTLKRPENQTHTPAALTVHVVYAWEVDPPAGDKPVEWRLITTEPIDTVAQVMRVIDAYRTRWLIEEFFKCLKTGCAYEKRQLESFDTLLIALALLAPIAWQLLLLRHLARETPDTSACVALTARQLDVLRASPAGASLCPQATTRAALCALARLGGHLRQNGEPGWLVLGRGMQKLLWMEAGWVAAQDNRTM